jgi:hypothetical protein
VINLGLRQKSQLEEFTNPLDKRRAGRLRMKNKALDQVLSQIVFRKYL